MKVFILEDCEIFRLSLTLILSQEPDIEVVGAIGSNSEDINNLIIKSDCDVLLLGLRLRHKSGLDIARQLKQSRRDVPILSIGFTTDVVNVPEMKSVGIKASLPMHSSNEYIIKKVRQSRDNLERCDFSGYNSSARNSIIQNKQ